MAKKNESATTDNSQPKERAEKDVDLIEVTKGSDTLKVHPSNVAAHAAAGWKVAG